MAAAAPPALAAAEPPTRAVPRFTVDLSAPARTRWAAVAAAYKGPITAVERQMQDMVVEHAPLLGTFATNFVSATASAAATMGMVFYGHRHVQ